MPKVRFLKTRRLKDGTGTTYEKGKVYDLPPSSVERWERRGLVESVGSNAKASEPIVTQQENKVPVEPAATPLPSREGTEKITPEQAFPDE